MRHSYFNYAHRNHLIRRGQGGQTLEELLLKLKDISVW